MDGCIENHYSMDINGDDYLHVKNNVITYSEKLENIICLIQCNINDKTMLVSTRSDESFEWEEINMDGLKENAVIDLSNKGNRWEGNLLNGYPYGFGCLFDEENQLTYNGFMFNGKKVCFGTCYYGDFDLVEYIGNFYKNSKCGYGKLFNKKRELIYEGEWFDNKPAFVSCITIKNELKEKMLYFGIEKIIISEFCKTRLEWFCISHFYYLKELIMNSNSCKTIQKFMIDNCDKLERVIIGENCCVNMANNIDEWKRIGSLFCISNCEQLKVIEIGDNSFGDYNEIFELYSLSLFDYIILDLPSLERLSIASDCFYWLYNLSIESR